ncbi:MAG: SpvB/TcaC N-terminal domain-containing protein [Syntrophobacteraceae bacterium]
MFTWKRFRAFLCLFLSILMILPAVPVRAQEADTAVLQEADTPVSEDAAAASEAELAPEDGAKVKSSKKDKPEDDSDAIKATATSTTSTGEDGGDGSGLGVSVQAPEASLFTGAASHKIAIEVPPGRGGISPNIAMVYNSYRLNGWVGVGWDLDLGSIQRSTKHGLDIDPDTQEYTGNDFIAVINGSKADLVQRTDWDAGGNTYGAKIEGSFMRFVAVNPDSDGQPQGGWEVTTKEGTKYFYGATSDSRQSDPATTNPHGTFKWCLNRVEDMDGNFMTITYDKALGDGEIYPKYIDYTGNTKGLSTTNRVEFTLEPRSEAADKPIRYNAHFAVRTSYRLSAITVTSSEVAENCGLIREYALAYGSSPTTSRSLLQTVTEYGSDGTALPAVNLTYTMGVNEFDDAADTSKWKKEKADAYYSGGYRMADVNNDGLQDIVYTGSKIRVLLSTGSGFKADAVWGARTKGLHQYAGGIKLADMNLDGRADFVYVDSSKRVHVLLAQPPSACGAGNPDGCFAADSTASPAVWATQAENFYVCNQVGDGFRLADVNGDGYPDYVYRTPAKDVKVLLNNSGTGFLTESKWGKIVDIARGRIVAMADMNADGRSDLLYCSADYVNESWITSQQILLSTDVGCQTGSDCFEVHEWKDTPGLSRPTDHNGDGLIDVRGWLNMGDGTEFAATNIIYPYQYQGSIVGIKYDIDLNADGLGDPLFQHFKTTDSNIHVALGTGEGLENETVWGSRKVATGDLFWAFTLPDVNGDGLPDYIYLANGGDYGYFRRILHKGPYPDLLQSVSNGIGATYTLGYTPSSAYQNTNLPYVVQTLSSITLNDGNGNESVTNYTYQGGLHSFKEREFGGFASATVTSPMITNGDGSSYQTSVETRFYQGNPTTGENDEKKGLIKEQVVKDNISGKYYKKSESTLSTASFLSGTVKFPHLSRQDDYVWDGSTTTEDVGTAWHTYATFEYDDSGNVTRKHFKGDASIPGDEKDEETDYYAKDEDTWLSSRPWKTRLKNAQGVVESETEYTYYGSPHLNRLWHKIAKVGGANGSTISYEYDSYGNVSKVTDPRGYFSTTAYDGATRTFPAAVTNPLGHQAVYTYDYRFGKVKTKQDPNHNPATNPNIIQYVYDPFGRIQMEIGPDACANGWTAYYLYNSFGTVGAQNVETRRTEACGVSGYIWKKAYFDGLGREIKAEAEGSPDSLGNPRTITSHTIYDLKGQVSKKCIPHFGSICTTEVTNEYDPVGRTVKTISPDDSPYNPTGESITQTAYAKTRTTVTDPNGHIKTAVKDSYGRLSAVEEYSAEPACNPCTTSYGYDARGNLTGVTDAKGNHTTIVYDDLSRKTGMTDPDMGTWTYGYDANGNLIVQQDANGNIMNFVYDSLNRAIRKYSSDSTIDVYYYYDEGAAADNVKGRLTRSEDASGNTRYYYDKFGKAKKTIKTVDTESYTSEASYDYLGRPLTVTNPFKTGETPEVITYQYDAGGNLSDVLNYAAYSDYNALGQVGKITFQTGTTTTYGYYPLTNKLESVVTTPPPPQAGKLQDLAYEYDSVGNVKKITDSTNLQSIQVYEYGYDALDRLDWANYPSIGQIDYNYDSIGNIIYNSRVGAYSYIGAGPHAVTGAGGETFEYDNNGNMTGIDVGTAQEKLFEYDAENRLVRFKIKQTNGSYATIQYVYDGGGQRVKKISSSGATTTYIGNLELRGTEKTTHYFGGDKRIATKVGSDLYDLHSDHLGGLNVADEAGVEKQRNTYLPFGEDFQSSGTANLRHKYTDQEQDPETTIGLYYYGARYYYPKIGRFISPDSIVQAPQDPQTLNRYSYCRNNPLRYTDPTGHSFFGEIGKFFTKFFDTIISFIVGTLATGGNPVGGIIAASGNVFLSHTGAGRQLTQVVAKEVFDDALGFPPGLAYMASSITLNATIDYAMYQGYSYATRYFASSGSVEVLGDSYKYDDYGSGEPCQECTGEARVLKGNSETIGKEGAWPGVKIQEDSAAIAYEQFGMTKGELRPILGEISGNIGDGKATFSNVADVIGGKSPIPNINVRAALQLLNPGKFIIEIPSLAVDLGTQPIILTIPKGVNCPAGTVPRPPLQ